VQQPPTPTYEPKVCFDVLLNRTIESLTKKVSAISSQQTNAA
jgi:hypothetical protein